MGESISSEAIVASCFLGVFFFSYGLFAICIRYVSMSRWLKLQGAILDVDTQDHVAYSYQFGNRTYVGSRISGTDAFSMIRKSSVRSDLGLKKSDSVTIYVCPSQPKASCIERKLNVKAVLTFSFSVLAMLLIAIAAMRDVYFVWPLVAFSFVVAFIASVVELIKYLGTRSRVCS